MGEIKRQARAHWAGGLTDGRGQATTASGVLEAVTFSAPSRFAKGNGTNPEELIAAAEASCFSMMLAKLLSDQNRSVDEINTQATVVLRQENGSAKISEVHLRTEAKVAGTDQETFRKLAEDAKENCPVSMLLKPGLEKLTLEATLI